MKALCSKQAKSSGIKALGICRPVDLLKDEERTGSHHMHVLPISTHLDRRVPSSFDSYSHVFLNLPSGGAKPYYRSFVRNVFLGRIKT